MKFVSKVVFGGLRPCKNGEQYCLTVLDENFSKYQLYVDFDTARKYSDLQQFEEVEVPFTLYYSGKDNQLKLYYRGE